MELGQEILKCAASFQEKNNKKEIEFLKISLYRARTHWSTAGPPPTSLSLSFFLVHSCSSRELFFLFFLSLSVSSPCSLAHKCIFMWCLTLRYSFLCKEIFPSYWNLSNGEVCECDLRAWHVISLCDWSIKQTSCGDWIKIKQRRAGGAHLIGPHLISHVYRERESQECDVCENIFLPEAKWRSTGIKTMQACYQWWLTSRAQAVEQWGLSFSRHGSGSMD